MVLPPFTKNRTALSFSFANKFIQTMLSHMSHTNSWCGSAASTDVLGQGLRRYIGSRLTFVSVVSRTRRIKGHLSLDVVNERMLLFSHRSHRPIVARCRRVLSVGRYYPPSCSAEVVDALTGGALRALEDQGHGFEYAILTFLLLVRSISIRALCRDFS